MMTCPLLIDIYGLSYSLSLSEIISWCVLVPQVRVVRLACMTARVVVAQVNVALHGEGPEQISAK